MFHKANNTDEAVASSAASSTRHANTTHSVSRGAEALNRYQQLRKKRSRISILKHVLAGIGVAATLGIIAIALYIAYINATLQSGIDKNLLKQLHMTEPGSTFYMLLLGVDKDQNRVNSKEYGKDPHAYRSDSIMLVRVDPKNKKVTLVSIHRDTLVELKGHGKQKINAAYSIGGPAYATEVISKFAGVPISHYADIDFDNFVSVVDSIGGIEVTVPKRVNDKKGTGEVVEAGKQVLNGKKALVLCRARHAYDAYGDGDLYRAANQRMIISAIGKKILELDPVSMTNAIAKLANAVTTDMDVNTIVGLATQLRGINTEKDIYSGMEPTTSRYVNNTWYEICNTTAWQKMMQRVNKGLSPYEHPEDNPTIGIAGVSGGFSNTPTSSEGTSSGGTAPNGSAQSPNDSNPNGSTNSQVNRSGRVRVLNAAGTNGLAGRISATLKNQGFNAKPGNANTTYKKTIIVYNGNNEATAQAINDTLGGGIKVVKNNGQYATDYDVVVIVGADKSKQR